jgi:hypothetical protein
MHRLQLIEDVLHNRATVSQAGLELKVIGFIDLMQQVLLMFLQNLPEQLFFLFGQPQFHGDLPTLNNR